MSISRRDFLKVIVSTGAFLGSIKKTVARVGSRFHRKIRYGMLIDLRKCYGCHACSISCKAEQDVPLGKFKSWVVEGEKGTFPNVSRTFIPVLCNQCDDAPCVKGCPTGATWKREDGIVIQEEDTCIGCSYCIVSCPYDAKYQDPRTGTAQKCDFCVHKVDQGLVPSCVNTCNAGARIFGDLNDPKSEISKLIATNKVQTLRPEQGTKPHVFYVDLDPSVYEASRREKLIKLHEKEV